MWSNSLPPNRENENLAQLRDQLNSGLQSIDESIVPGVYGKGISHCNKLISELFLFSLKKGCKSEIEGLIFIVKTKSRLLAFMHDSEVKFNVMDTLSVISEDVWVKGYSEKDANDLMARTVKEIDAHVENNNFNKALGACLLAYTHAANLFLKLNMDMDMFTDVLAAKFESISELFDKKIDLVKEDKLLEEHKEERTKRSFKW